MVAIINSVLKALFAGAAALSSALVAATVDGSGISTNEWLVAVGAFIAAFGAVYFVPNTPISSK